MRPLAGTDDRPKGHAWRARQVCHSLVGDGAWSSMTERTVRHKFRQKRSTVDDSMS